MTTDHTDPTFDEPMPRLWRTLNTPTVFDGPDPWIEFARRTIPTPPYVYRRRRLTALVILAAIVLALAAIHGGAIRDEAPPADSPDILTPATGAGFGDGRYHPCGYVTDDGVTEYLDTFIARCGDSTYGGDYR